MTNATTLDTLRSVLAAAEAHAVLANESYEAVDSIEEGDPNAHVVDWSIEADRLRDAAKEALGEALIDDDAPRMWTAIQDGVTERLGEMTIAEACEAAGNWIRGAYYGEVESTIWVRAYVECEETGERELVKARIDPDMPACSESEHDWQAPYEILGGLRENPGVWGKGGGIIVREVCMHCGCEQTTDSWAQDRETGEQGLTSISYEAGKYAAEVEALREEDAADDIDEDAA